MKMSPIVSGSTELQVTISPLPLACILVEAAADIAPELIPVSVYRTKGDSPKDLFQGEDVEDDVSLST